MTTPANTLMEIPYDRPIFFIYLLALENSPSNFLGAKWWPADLKNTFSSAGYLDKLLTLASKHLRQVGLEGPKRKVKVPNSVLRHINSIYSRYLDTTALRA